MADDKPVVATRRPAPGGVVVPNQPRWYQRLAAAVVYGLIRSVALTLRYRLHDRSGAFGTPHLDAPAIFCVWHNRLALCLIVYRRYVVRAQTGRRMAAMVSASKDGALLARVLEWFQVQPVRGSTSRRGPQALRELVAWGEKGYDLAITPDGPRGPCYVVQEGIISAAQLSGQPIVPVSYSLPWKIRMGSWDGFQIPVPFSICHVHAAELVRVPREADDAERESSRKLLEDRLKSITQD